MSHSIKRQPNTSTAIANADLMRIYDASDADERKITVQNLLRKSATVTAAGPTDNVDVTGCSVLFLDTASNHVTVGGLSGGVAGQILHVVRTSTTNNAILEHNEGGGSQDIFLADEGDQTLTTYGGWTLVCNGTSWFEVGY
jgi:hypothetical protein